MSLPTGTFHLGPDDATLTVRTGTAGPMAKAGHDLEIRVTRWSARLELAEDLTSGSLSLEVDSRSFSVIDGHGGPKALTDDDRTKIVRNIDEKVLHGSEITFASDRLEARGDQALDVSGQLTLRGVEGPAHFTLEFSDDGAFRAQTEVLQTAFGFEPYSAMMGALRVSDEIGIEIDGQLSAAAQS